MKKEVVAIALAVMIGMSGCGDDEPIPPVEEQLSGRPSYDYTISGAYRFIGENAFGFSLEFDINSTFPVNFFMLTDGFSESNTPRVVPEPNTYLLARQYAIECEKAGYGQHCEDLKKLTCQGVADTVSLGESSYYNRVEYMECWINDNAMQKFDIYNYYHQESGRDDKKKHIFVHFKGFSTTYKDVKLTDQTIHRYADKYGSVGDRVEAMGTAEYNRTMEPYIKEVHEIGQL